MTPKNFMTLESTAYRLVVRAAIALSAIQS